MQSSSSKASQHHSWLSAQMRRATEQGGDKPSLCGGGHGGLAPPCREGGSGGTGQISAVPIPPRCPCRAGGHSLVRGLGAEEALLIASSNLGSALAASQGSGVAQVALGGAEMVSLAPKLVSALVGQGYTATSSAPRAVTRFPRARMTGEARAKPG